MKEPIERRVIHGIGALLGVATWLLIIWNYLDPDGPHSFMSGVRESFNDWRQYNEGMRRTFDDIEGLPETESA